MGLGKGRRAVCNPLVAPSAVTYVSQPWPKKEGSVLLGEAPFILDKGKRRLYRFKAEPRAERYESRLLSKVFWLDLGTKQSLRLPVSMFFQSYSRESFRSLPFRRRYLYLVSRSSTFSAAPALSRGGYGWSDYFLKPTSFAGLFINDFFMESLFQVKQAFFYRKVSSDLDVKISALSASSSTIPLFGGNFSRFFAIALNSFNERSRIYHPLRYYYYRYRRALILDFNRFTLDQVFLRTTSSGYLEALVPWLKLVLRSQLYESWARKWIQARFFLQRALLLLPSQLTPLQVLGKNRLFCPSISQFLKLSYTSALRWYGLLYPKPWKDIRNSFQSPYKILPLFLSTIYGRSPRTTPAWRPLALETTKATFSATEKRAFLRWPLPQWEAFRPVQDYRDLERLLLRLWRLLSVIFVILLQPSLVRSSYSILMKTFVLLNQELISKLTLCGLQEKLNVRPCLNILFSLLHPSYFSVSKVTALTAVSMSLVRIKMVRQSLFPTSITPARGSKTLTREDLGRLMVKSRYYRFRPRLRAKKPAVSRALAMAIFVLQKSSFVSFSKLLRRDVTKFSRLYRYHRPRIYRAFFRDLRSKSKASPQRKDTMLPYPRALWSSRRTARGGYKYMRPGSKTSSKAYKPWISHYKGRGYKLQTYRYKTFYIKVMRFYLIFLARLFRGQMGGDFRDGSISRRKKFQARLQMRRLSLLLKRFFDATKWASLHFSISLRHAFWCAAHLNFASTLRSFRGRHLAKSMLLQFPGVALSFKKLAIESRCLRRISSKDLRIIIKEFSGKLVSGSVPASLPLRSSSRGKARTLSVLLALKLLRKALSPFRRSRRSKKVRLWSL